MSILCGNKKAHTEKTYHPTTADVRACFAGQNSMQTAEPRTKFEQTEQVRAGLAPAIGTSAILERLRTQHARNDEAREMQRRERQDDERAYASKHEIYPAYDMVTAKQVAFINRLEADREFVPFDVPVERLTKREASARIELLLAAPKRRNQVSKGTPVLQDGMYQNPTTGEIYKVQWNRAGGDGRRLYAKKLVEDKYGDGSSFRFAYTPGLIDKIRPDWKMTREQASAFGKLYGICVRCHRDLTDEESIAMGIGPICAGKEGWA